MNCAVCDSRTMSCAPRLISLSSSGNRYYSVSRESSVHSMISMNCFFRKSIMAIVPLCPVSGDTRLFLGLRQLLDLGVGVLHFGLDPLRRYGTGNDRAVDEHQRRRRIDLEARAELGRLGDRVVAVALVVGQRAGFEERVPRLHAIGRAPDDSRLAGGIRMQLVDRKEARVDSDVVDGLHLAFVLVT